MIAHPSDDLAVRNTIAFCQRLSAAKDETPKPITCEPEPAPKSSPFHATVFRINGTVERYPLG
ncbi:hypothetical protein [Methylobacterium thuringiense]|uniref:Uncharacterized protein n=1 Tax=Methylobacterium thuringiense TaxID=1003091 RepID=A0ABQ4TKI6_9HYPH|nr:hypothetical protein [Methylobacterium thuringiense]GJE54562.1 hypothetical protein EKPJFOCH_1040 [Methylobacterium thuringiense]